MLFLRGPRSVGKVSKHEACHRNNLLTTGEWGMLWHEALTTVHAQSLTSGPRGLLTKEQRAASACRKVQLGEVTRARRCLTGTALALGSEPTFREMQSKRPQQIQRPRRVVGCELDPVQVDRKIIMKSLKRAPRGSGRCTYEHVRALLDVWTRSNCCSKQHPVWHRPQSLPRSGQLWQNHD